MKKATPKKKTKKIAVKNSTKAEPDFVIEKNMKTLERLKPLQQKHILLWNAMKDLAANSVVKYPTDKYAAVVPNFRKILEQKYGKQFEILKLDETTSAVRRLSKHSARLRKKRGSNNKNEN